MRILMYIILSNYLFYLKSRTNIYFTMINTSIFYFLYVVLISSTGRSVDQMLPLATIDAYPTEGFVFFVEQGMSGKLCAANFQTDIPNEKMSVALQTIASSLCRTLNYQ